MVYSVARTLRAADVFALFSTYEGLPHVVLEAMAAGTPVVASAAGGTPETMRDGESGLLVPVGDEGALAGQALEDEHRDRPQVGAEIHGLQALGLLWAQVVRRAD